MKSLIKKLLREGLIREEANGKHLVVVDIQPEYQSIFGSMAEELAEYLNENYNNLQNITFLYNGESLGMIEEHEYRRWWAEDMGLDEEITYGVEMYDKGYAFFRYCMDSGIDHDSTTNLVKHMMVNDVHDSRELDSDFWDSFVDEYGDDDVRDLMEFSDDAINIPDLIDELKTYGNIILTGGGVDECLKEVEIALNALGKPYTIWDKYTY